MAVVAFYIGIYYFILFLGDRTRRVNSSFSFMCLAIGFYNICCVGNYNATHYLQGWYWQRFQLFTLAFVSIGLLGFVTDYTGLERKKTNICIMAFFGVCALVQLFDQSDLTWIVSQPLIKTFDLYGKTITYNEVAQGIFTDIQAYAFLCFFTYIYWLSFYYYRKVDSRKGLPLLLSTILFCLAMFEDVMVSTGFYDFVYTLEYGYVGFLLIMTYAQTTQENKLRGQLSETESRYRSLISNIPIGIFRTTCDGQIVSINPAFVKILGYDTEEELLSVPADKIWRFPNQRQILLKRLKEKGPLKDFEAEFCKKDGSTCLVSLSVQGGYHPDGDLEFIDGMGRDITERKKYQKDLVLKQYYLTKAQEMGRIGTWELDVLRNRQVGTDETYRIYGLPIGAELTYEMFLDIVHPQDREYVQDQWQMALEGAPYDVEHRIIVEGEVKWVRQKAELSFNDKGECDRAVGFIQDISSMKKTEQELNLHRQHLEKLVEERTQQLVQAERLAATGRLAASVAHEINNPLQGMSIHLDLMNDAIPGSTKSAKSEAHYDHVKKISPASRRSLHNCLIFISTLKMRKNRLISMD